MEFSLQWVLNLTGKRRSFAAELSRQGKLGVCTSQTLKITVMSYSGKQTCSVQQQKKKKKAGGKSVFKRCAAYLNSPNYSEIRAHEFIGWCDSRWFIFLDLMNGCCSTCQKRVLEPNQLLSSPSIHAQILLMSYFPTCTAPLPALCSICSNVKPAIDHELNNSTDTRLPQPPYRLWMSLSLTPK